jgi:carbon monoxide dehydrogenase subunit G
MAKAEHSGPIRGSTQRRIAAPVDAVWNELQSPDAVIATMPLEQVHFDLDAKSATFSARLGIGPFALARTGSGRMTEFKVHKRVVFEMVLDDQSMSSLHIAELAPGGAEETVLTYTVELRPAHPMPRLRRFLKGVFELHVRDYADRISATAARHWKAEQALGLRAPRDQ